MYTSQCYWVSTKSRIRYGGMGSAAKGQIHTYTFAPNSSLVERTDKDHENSPSQFWNQSGRWASVRRKGRWSRNLGSRLLSSKEVWNDGAREWRSMVTKLTNFDTVSAWINEEGTDFCTDSLFVFQSRFIAFQSQHRRVHLRFNLFEFKWFTFLIQKLQPNPQKPDEFAAPS